MVLRSIKTEHTEVSSDEDLWEEVSSDTEAKGATVKKEEKAQDGMGDKVPGHEDLSEDDVLSDTGAKGGAVKKEEKAQDWMGEKGKQASAYYAVGHGKDGRTGVYETWGEAAPLVICVSGAIHKKCGSIEEAVDFVERTQAQRRLVMEEEDWGYV